MTATRSFPGNRLPVPRSIGGHFFYRTQSPPLDPKDVALVGKAAAHEGLRSSMYDNGQVELPRLSAFSKEAAEALERVSENTLNFLKERGFSVEESELSLVACRWAAPHTDPAWRGMAFYSTVLHTGPYEYMMVTMGSSVRKERVRFCTSENRLGVGQSFLFDACTPHTAAPLNPHEESFLVLLQVELNDHTVEERRTLIAALPKMEGTSDTSGSYE